MHINRVWMEAAQAILNKMMVKGLNIGFNNHIKWNSRGNN